jgi:Family of unknown function (DUF6399)
VPGLAFLHRLILALPVVFVEVGACGMRLVCLLLPLTGLDRFVGASSGTQQQVNRHVEAARVVYKREATSRLAQEMPPQEITATQDETFTGGLGWVAIEPVRNSILLEHTAEARDHATWQALRQPALAGRNGRGIQATSDEAPGLLASVEHHLGAPHSPDLFPVQHALSKAVSGPLATKQRAAAKAVTQAEETLKPAHEYLAMATNAPVQRGPGRPPKGVTNLEQGKDALEGARDAHQRLSAQREQVTQGIRALGHAYHFVDLERGVRRHGKRIAGDIHAQLQTMRTIAQQAALRQVCLKRLEKAARVLPKMQATIECVSGDVRQQVSQLALSQPASYALHAHLMPSYYLERVAATRTVTAGAPLRALAEPLRTPLFESGGALDALSPMEQNQLKHKAQTLAEVLQRSSSNVEGRNGYLSLRHHQLRGLDHPRKRACLTAVHNFFLTRPDGTPAAERFFGQKLRSMLGAILGAVEIPPAPLSPPRRVGIGSKGVGWPTR